MITFERLRLQNFLSFKEASLNLEAQGIVAIEGKNNSNKCFTSNGSGKSTLLEAFCWVLWGATIRGYKADEIINTKIGKNCAVEISFKDNAEVSWEIKRYRKHSEFGNKVFLYREGGEWTQNVDVQEKIDEVLGMDFKTFVSSFIFFKNDSKSFSNSTDSEQKKMLEKLYDLEKYSTLLTIVRDKMAKVVSNCHAVSLDINVNELKYNMLLTDIDKLEKDREKFEIDKLAKIQELTSKLYFLETARDEEKIKFEVDKKNRIRTVEAEVVKARDLLKLEEFDFNITKKKDLEELANQLKMLVSKQAINSDNIPATTKSEHTKELVEIDRKLQDIQNKVFSPDLPTLQKGLESNQKYLNQLDVSILQFSSQLSDLKTKKEHFENDLGIECPYCLQPVSPGHQEKHINQLLASLQEKKAEYDKVVTSKREANDAIIQVKQNIRAVESQMETDRKTERSLFSLKSDLLTKLQVADQELLKIERSIDQVRLKIEQRSNGEYSNRTAETNLELLKNKVLDFQKEQYSNTSIVVSIETTSIQLKNTNSSTYLNEDTIEYKSQEAVELHEHNSKLKAKEKDLKEKLRHYEFFDAAFSRAGIPSFLLDNILPTLNKYAQYYSSILTGGLMKIEFNNQSALKSTKEIREKFEVKVYAKDGSESYKGDSSGEKRRVDLIVLFALQKAAMTRNKSKFNVLFLDEVFDTLDKAGLENVVALLEEEVQTFPSIFCISHDDFLSSYFDSVVTVQKDADGFSSIIGS
jgi:DNA repair exonuclease SbcCD ATPase subunit